MIPLLVVDEAQHLPDDFFLDLAGFLNYAFDSRDLLTVWLVGLPSARSPAGASAPLGPPNTQTRVFSCNRISPRPEREDFLAMIDHAMETAGAKTRLFSESALKLLWRASRGVTRIASKLLRAALIVAHDRDQSFVDDEVLTAAIDPPGRGAADGGVAPCGRA